MIVLKMILVTCKPDVHPEVVSADPRPTEPSCLTRVCRRPGAIFERNKMGNRITLLQRWIDSSGSC